LGAGHDCGAGAGDYEVFGRKPGSDAEVIYTGTRPGEKLYEEILTLEEIAVVARHREVFVSIEA